MFKIFLLLCICCYGSVSAQQNQAVPIEIQQALLFSREIEATLVEFVHDAVPLAAQNDAQKIVDEAKAGVTRCESGLQTVDQIWRYKTCSSTILRNAMTALTKLASDAHAHAGNTAAGWCWLSSVWLSLIMLKVLH